MLGTAGVFVVQASRLTERGEHKEGETYRLLGADCNRCGLADHLLLTGRHICE